METYIKGNYKRSIYTSDNGFVIGIFKIKETNEENLKEFINKTITFTGQFAELNVDDTYFFYGEMVEHQKYGLQFKVNEYERVKPSDKDGIIEFLSSDLFNGIGEKIATQIVETLGENALDKILEEKSNLYLVPKLSSKKIDIIYNTLTKYEESHKTIVYLTELGFNMKDSLNIYNFYKSNTIIQIESNIFKIIDDIEEISFTKIDEISKKLNYKENDINRIKSCILYVMKSLTYKNGDTYLNLNEIYINAINYLKIELNKEEFNTYLDELSIEQKIHIENDKYYLNNIYEAENRVSNKLNTLLNIPLTKYKKLDTYIELLEKENNIKYKIIGNGSNLIFLNKYYDGILIKLEEMNELMINENKIVVGAGYSLIRLANKMSKLGYSGLEFATGIPGTIGGAIYMNAGAYNSDMGYIVSEIKVLTPQLELKTLYNKDLDFHYRSSFLQKNKDYICLEATLILKKANKEQIMEIIEERKTRRLMSQPLEYPSAGSVFRNPTNDYAGRLIEEIGYKGKIIGGAQVSEKHANFIINKGNATGKDVYTLINEIQNKIKEKYNIELKVEQEYVE